MEDKKVNAPQNEERPDNVKFETFSRAAEKMIATNDMAYSNWGIGRGLRERTKSYSPEEVSSIIESGSANEQQKLSRAFFNKDGYYRRIIIYYATLLKYMGLLIPNPKAGKNLSNSRVLRKYYSALDYVKSMNLPVLLTSIAQRALVDGAYYGLKVDNNDGKFQLIDLPSGYACSRFKDIDGNDVVEFDVRYFDSLSCEEQRKLALAAYPKFVVKAWNEWHKNKRKSSWIIVPKEIGVCFPFFDGRPLFLDIIPAIMQYDEAVNIQQERDIEEIRKIIIQKIPHLSDGRLLFEPDETANIHSATVGMMKKNKNVNVLTTYADVDAITSSTSADRADDSLSRMEQNIYSKAGVTGLIFASTGSSSLGASLNNDLSLMMYLTNKFSNYITNMLNDEFGDRNVDFKYMILPISYYNTDDFISSSFKLVGSGFSALMPALAQGLSQQDLVNVKDLENKVLKLRERLVPLSTSYTQSSRDVKNGSGQSSEVVADTDENEGGRPEKADEEKSDKTIQNEESIDRTGGGS